MKHRLTTFLLLSLFTILFAFSGDVNGQNPCSDGTAYKNCRACGRAKKTPKNPTGKISAKTQALNVEKNRDDAATNTTVLTVQEIRDPAKNDVFTADMEVEVVGFVASLDNGGFRESCNCGRVDLRDIHINIVASKAERKNASKFVVVEITPRWQEKLNLDQSDYDAMKHAVKDQIVGKWVRFKGWMLYDHIHASESRSTAPKSKPTCKTPGQTGCVWRATPWEVHPVTSFEVLDGPPNDD